MLLTRVCPCLSTFGAKISGNTWLRVVMCVWNMETETGRRELEVISPNLGSVMRCQGGGWSHTATFLREFSFSEVWQLRGMRQLSSAKVPSKVNRMPQQVPNVEVDLVTRNQA